MNIRVFTCVAMIAAAPAIAQEAALAIRLIPGHAVHHESKEAGVAMALRITPGRPGATDLMAICEELRLAAGLDQESGGLRLETMFVVPYKAMAVEGLYLPSDATSQSHALVRGKDLARATLDDIVARAGIPPRLLDEAMVEQEISCTPGEPSWLIAWTDLQPIGEKEPQAVIARARQRFLAVHQSVVAYNGAEEPLRAARRAGRGGSERPRCGVAARPCAGRRSAPCSCWAPRPRARPSPDRFRHRSRPWSAPRW